MKVKLGNLTWKIHEQRQRVHESLELRRRMTEAAHAEQIARERAALSSHLDGLVPGARRAFLANRLDRLNAM
jgi:hypothetical protein